MGRHKATRITTLRLDIALLGNYNSFIGMRHQLSATPKYSREAAKAQEGGCLPYMAAMLAGGWGYQPLLEGEPEKIPFRAGTIFRCVC